MSASVSTAGAALSEARGSVPPSEARLLLQHVLGCSHADIAAHPERALDAAVLQRYRTLVARRAQGEPVAYLTGRREFFGRDFHVARGVLIPRPETELLVELALTRLSAPGAARILDLGTGSGALAVTLALERPGANVTAVDRAPDALAVARRNATALEAEVHFVLGDWFSALGDARYELIVANPPYVAAGDPHLDRGDVRFEPHGALVGGADGLTDIRQIIVSSPPHLVPGGWLLLEHGYDQAATCRALLNAAGFVDVASWSDLAGIERVSGGRTLA